MVNFRTILEKIPFPSSNKARSILLGCLLGFFFFFLVRSCTSDQSDEATYRIGQVSKWENINLMGRERNLAAFNSQLLAAVAKQGKFRIVVRTASSTELISDLEQGKLQGILTALQPSYLNEERLLFSEPYLLTGPVLIIPSTAPLENWNEKRKKIVGIPSHSPVLATLEQDPTIQIKIYDDILRALADLSERGIDGAIFPAIPSYTYVNAFYKNELQIATLPLTDEGIRLVVQNNADGKALIEHFNVGIAAIKNSGEFNQLLNQWGLINTESINPSK